MVFYSALLFGLFFLVSTPIFAEESKKLPNCNEITLDYPANDREKLFKEVVATLRQNANIYYDCALERLASEIWIDSKAGRDKIIRNNVQEFKYKGETTEDFVATAVNSWKERFERNKKKTYMGCFFGKKNNGKSKAVCLFI